MTETFPLTEVSIDTTATTITYTEEDNEITLSGNTNNPDVINTGDNIVMT